MQTAEIFLSFFLSVIITHNISSLFFPFPLLLSPCPGGRGGEEGREGEAPILIPHHSTKWDDEELGDIVSHFLSFPLMFLDDGISIVLFI